MTNLKILLLVAASITIIGSQLLLNQQPVKTKAQAIEPTIEPTAINIDLNDSDIIDLPTKENVISNNDPERKKILDPDASSINAPQKEQIRAETRLVLLQNDRPDVYISDQDMQLGLSQKTLWKPINKEDAVSQLTYPLPQEKIDDGRQFIGFQPFRLEVTLVGETFELQLPNATTPTLRAEVTERTVLDGIIHWRGFFPDDNKKFHEFSFTQALSDNYVVGNVYFSGGSYTIEAKDNIGWIAPQENDLHNTKDSIQPPNPDKH
ncbi:metalloprotease secretion chaperone CpaB [Pelagibaculum spongiae]|uniref:Metalloprotease secretion chaperone CpaB n=1 Tax=Pelagibaculum spongiae TaxID=2080658 RepID=A0A2V1GRQ9_9GAMM|nr:metalloprotease secretion chaperone CpaB [Pelagibaculum spongiae]PVZ66664.1 metalloprotease secretion chaperone CpaB [Pelagibaculum spongiae]